MLDYSELNRIAAKNNGILTKLDLVYQLATGSYGELSRFSIALIDNKVGSIVVYLYLQTQTKTAACQRSVFRY